jgi:tetratricopeptide (TPR) repeat protein
MKNSLGFLTVLAVGIAFSSQAGAAITVMGNGLARTCFEAARDVSLSRPGASTSVAICSFALEDGSLTPQDMLATHVNRGILLMADGRYVDAMHDFDSAIAIDKSVGDVWVNRGAALLGQGKWIDGIAALDTGLKLNPSEPEKAYFNRAIADEALDDSKSAYFDFSKAAELKPDWEQPRMELQRFTIGAKPKV